MGRAPRRRSGDERCRLFVQSLACLTARLMFLDERQAEEYPFPEDLDLDEVAMEASETMRGEEQTTSDHTDYGSDDDEYQHLLMEAALEAERASKQQAASLKSDQRTDVTMS